VVCEQDVVKLLRTTLSVSSATLYIWFLLYDYSFQYVKKEQLLGGGIFMKMILMQTIYFAMTVMSDCNALYITDCVKTKMEDHTLPGQDTQ